MTPQEILDQLLAASQGQPSLQQAPTQEMLGQSPGEIMQAMQRKQFEDMLRQDNPASVSVLPDPLKDLTMMTSAIGPDTTPNPTAVGDLGAILDRAKAEQGYDVTKRSARLDAMNLKSGNSLEVRAKAINEEENHIGIQAGIETKKDGTKGLVLSGTGPSGIVPIYGTNQEGVAGTVRDLVGKLRQTTDPDAARALQAQLNEAAAGEAARIQGEARKHAEDKIGVPLLEASLSQSIRLDRESPGYYPGRGDSQNTMQARQALNTARSAADLEASRTLKSNVTQNSLEAALRTAQMETQRISRIGDKQDQLSNVMESRRIAKEDQQNEKLDTIASSMTEDMKLHARILNPVLANASDRELAASVDKKRESPAYIDTLQANPQTLPKLAAEGNKYASTVLSTREAALGIPKERTDADVGMLREIMTSDTKLRQALKAISPMTKEGQNGVDSGLMDISSKSRGSKEEQALALENKYAIARKYVALQKTNNYMADVSSWGSTDPELQQAILTSKTITGKTSVDDVTNAYVGGAVGAERSAKVEKLISLMQTQAAMQKDSVFGMPNTMAIRNQILAYQLKLARDAAIVHTMDNTRSRM